MVLGEFVFSSRRDVLGAQFCDDDDDDGNDDGYILDR